MFCVPVYFFINFFTETGIKQKCDLYLARIRIWKKTWSFTYGLHIHSRPCLIMCNTWFKKDLREQYVSLSGMKVGILHFSETLCAHWPHTTAVQESVSPTSIVPPVWIWLTSLLFTICTVLGQDGWNCQMGCHASLCVWVGGGRLREQ